MEPHHCRCGAMMDKQGHHGLSCRENKGRYSRHADLKDVLNRTLATGGVLSRLEPVGLTPNDERRPDGLTLSAFTHGKSLCWDATCADTFCSTALSKTAISAGAAAAEAEERKRNHYQDISETYRFEPVAIETTGAIGPSTGRFLSELGRKIVSKTGERRASEWMYQRISVAIMRGNAASIISCTPD